MGADVGADMSPSLAFAGADVAFVGDDVVAENGADVVADAGRATDGLQQGQFREKRDGLQCTG